MQPKLREPVEESIPQWRHRRTVYATAGAKTIRADSGHGSSNPEVDFTQTDRWIDALDNPKAGKEARNQSHTGGNGVEASEPEDSSDRTLHGFERSRLRDEGGG